MARTHVVIADDVLKTIDTLVGQRGRSQFIEIAAREKLARLDLEATIRDTAGMLTAKDHPEWRDRVSTAAWVTSVRRAEGP